MMDVGERVFVVTCKTESMKCEKIRDNFTRKFHKKVQQTRLFMNY